MLERHELPIIIDNMPTFFEIENLVHIFSLVVHFFFALVVLDLPSVLYNKRLKLHSLLVSPPQVFVLYCKENSFFTLSLFLANE